MKLTQRFRMSAAHDALLVLAMQHQTCCACCHALRAGMLQMLSCCARWLYAICQAVHAVHAASLCYTVKVAAWCPYKSVLFVTCCDLCRLAALTCLNISKVKFSDGCLKAPLALIHSVLQHHVLHSMPLSTCHRNFCQPQQQLRSTAFLHTRLSQQSLTWRQQLTPHQPSTQHICQYTPYQPGQQLKDTTLYHSVFSQQKLN